MTREEAFAELEERKKKAQGTVRVRNEDLYAGSPMYFYCKYCGLESDVLPESYTERPRKVCNPCQSMKNEGWLE